MVVVLNAAPSYGRLIARERPKQLHTKCSGRKREAQPMAKKVTVTLVDDFDGEAAADETVEFGLDGVTYEIDLSSKNAKKLRDDLTVWVDKGRRVGGRVPGVGAPRSIGSRAPRSGNGPVAMAITCRPGAESRPT